jgi:hypothetical protein
VTAQGNVGLLAFSVAAVSDQGAANAQKDKSADQVGRVAVPTGHLQSLVDLSCQINQLNRRIVDHRSSFGIDSLDTNVLSVVAERVVEGDFAVGSACSNGLDVWLLDPGVGQVVEGDGCAD